LLATSRSLLRLSTKSSECLRFSRTTSSAHQLEPEELSPVSPPFPRTPSPRPSGRFAAAQQLHIVDPSRLAFTYDEAASTSHFISEPEPEVTKPFSSYYSADEETSSDEAAITPIDLDSDWTLSLGADLGLPEVPMPSLPQKPEPRRRFLSETQYLRPPPMNSRNRLAQRFSCFTVPAPEPDKSEWTLSLPLNQASVPDDSASSSSAANVPSVPRMVVEVEQQPAEPKISMDENVRQAPLSRSRKQSNAQREARIPREVRRDLGSSFTGANSDCTVTPSPSPRLRSILDAVESDFETSCISDYEQGRESKMLEKRLALAGKSIIPTPSMRAEKS
jgi:hypothetical protein